MSLVENELTAPLLAARPGGAKAAMIRIKDRRTGEVLLNVEGDSLQGADLRSACLLAADLRNADLRGADLRLADLRGADLQGANLEGADLGLASYSAKTRWPDGFNPQAAGARLVVDPSKTQARPWWKVWG